jgi:3-methyladenine DNA glycosylase Tag
MTENARLIEKLKTEAENLKDVEVKYDQWEADKNKTEEELPVSEGVSSYMVEQYKKDSKFGKQRGEFVERGFKKITNYGQWMMLND